MEICSTPILGEQLARELVLLGLVGSSFRGVVNWDWWDTIDFAAFWRFSTKVRESTEKYKWLQAGFKFRKLYPGR